MIDAGCGSGILSMNLSKKFGIEIIAMDMSHVIERAFVASRSNLCHFVQGSVLYPPIAEGVADLTHSHGVLHHTYDTLTAFKAIARLMRPGGQLYVWLYGKKRGWNRIKYMVIRALRFFISRMPRWLQQIVIYALIGFHLVIRSLKRLLGMRLAPIDSLGQFLVVTRDRYTPCTPMNTLNRRLSAGLETVATRRSVVARIGRPFTCSSIRLTFRLSGRSVDPIHAMHTYIVNVCVERKRSHLAPHC